MSKSNSRKAYVILLGVAVAGFIADRALLGGGFGPSAAEAASTPQVTDATDSQRQAQARLSERVAAAFERAAQESADLAAETPNLFDPTAAFGPASERESNQETQRKLEEEFLRTHKLTALSDHAVVINGNTLRVAEQDAIDGYRLTGIYREDRAMGAVLVKDDLTIRLPFHSSQTRQTDH